MTYPKPETPSVLIGCEESQAICQAMHHIGIKAYSCDLKPASGNLPQFHIQDDITRVIRSHPSWDLLILHPTCTALAVSGNHAYGPGKPKHPERLESLQWTIDLWKLAVRHSKRVAMENPKSVLFPKLKALNATVQFIQPHQFGHPEQKLTGFALSGLPKLQPTDDVYDRMMQLPKKERERVLYQSPSDDRAEIRSKTYPGVASAIAHQWGLPLILQQHQQSQP